MLTVYLPVTPAVIAGVESDGMLASGLELGINRDHTGIVELETEVLLAPDTVIEVDNKSLTHRPDLWGHYGMAREVAAITHHQLRDPVRLDLLPKVLSPIEVEIEDLVALPALQRAGFRKCHRRPLAALAAIPPGSDRPERDQQHRRRDQLRHVGAGPAHARLRSRQAARRHHLRTQRPRRRTDRRAQRRKLRSEPVQPGHRRFSQGPIAIAGVIGGLHSAIGSATKRIVLESACFEATSVRKTSVALKLRTDASMRFEKSQDPVNTVRGLARAIELLEQVSPGIRLVGGLAERKAEFDAPPLIELSVDWIAAKLGRPVTAQDVRTILESLGFQIAETAPGRFSVVVPSWRATKDVSIKDDLLEEVGRMLGYDSITPQAPLIESVVPPDDPMRTYQRRVRNMAAAQGFTEVYNYSFISEDMAARIPIPAGSASAGVESDRFGSNADAAEPAAWNPQEHPRKQPPPQFIPPVRNRPRNPSRHANCSPKKSRTSPQPSTRATATAARNLFELKRLAECLMPAV